MIRPTRWTWSGWRCSRQRRGAAVVAAGNFWRAYARADLGVLLLALSLGLPTAYGFHARDTAHPLLHLALFRVRTFRISVAGGFVTRLGVGGMPFLLPLFY